MKKYVVKVFLAADLDWVIHKKEFTDKKLAEEYKEKMFNKYYKQNPGRYDVRIDEVEVDKK